MNKKDKKEGRKDVLMDRKRGKERKGKKGQKGKAEKEKEKGRK